MEAVVEYLVEYLREEFRRHPDIRVRVISEDHEPGISVKTSSREYFFPFEWAYKQDFKSVQAQVREIRDGLKDWDT